MLFAIFSGLFGTALSTLVRLELAQPGSLVFAGNANLYHTSMAVHAIIMVFFLVTPVVFGGFGNYFLPIQVGARDVAYPKLNNFSLWTLPAGLIIMLKTLWESVSVSSLFTIFTPNESHLNWMQAILESNLILGFNYVPNVSNYSEYKFLMEPTNWLFLVSKETTTNTLIMGCNTIPTLSDTLDTFLPYVNKTSNMMGTMAGWTFTTPFSHSRFTGTPVDWAFAGLVVASFTSLLTLVNLVITWRYLKGRGSRYQKEFYPIILISILLSLRMLILVTPILNAGLFMLMADRHFFTSFFTVRAGGDMLLFQHLFWFFGHPEVYILVMPAFGIASTLIPYYVRKPLISKMHMVYAMHAIASMGFVVWGHHMYLVGIDNKARILFFVITVMIALPASVKVCGWVVAAVNSITFLQVEFLFAISFISLFIIGGVTGSFCAHAGTDIMLHDTYYVVGHFHVMLSGSLMGMLFAYIYFNIREFTGLYYPSLPAYLHTLFHLVGHLLTFVPMLWLGYAGMPRRIQDYPWSYAGWHSLASLGHMIVLVSLICFFITLSLTIFLKKPMLNRNRGYPFIAYRITFLNLDKSYAQLTKLKNNILGIKSIRFFFRTQNQIFI